MKKNEGWCAWFINIGAKRAAPYEWRALWKSLLQLGVDRKLLEKVEAASMVIRGVRIERWLIDKNDHEYASKKDTLEATKKLIYQAVISKGSPYAHSKLKKAILQKVSCSFRCFLPIGHLKKHSKYFCKNLQCGICGEIISYDQIMGKARATRGSKIAPDVCTMGHGDPLTSGGIHSAENIGWQHKRCNDCQGNLSKKDFLNLLNKIIRFNRK
jgi:hypothetical protein